MIGKSGGKRPSKPGGPDKVPGGVGDWLGVHWAMAALVAEWFSESDGLAEDLRARHGGEILEAMRHILRFSRQGQPGTENGYATVRVSSTRVALFRALVGLACLECQSPVHGAAGIPGRLKAFGEDLLKKERQCLAMPGYGKSIPELYALDPAWAREMVPHVFPSAAARKGHFVAAWERFLSVEPRLAMFSDPVFRRLYRRGLGLSAGDSHDRTLHDPEHGIGRHFAMAHFHVEGFGLDDALFRRFRERRSRGQHEGFIRLTGDLIGADRTEKPGFAGRRVTDFWESMLEDDTCTDLLAWVGPWICLRTGMFEPAHLARLTRRTLEKAGGRLDEHLDLRQSLDEFAKVAPRDTIGILECFLGRERMREHTDREYPYVLHKAPWDAPSKNWEGTPQPRERRAPRQISCAGSNPGRGDASAERRPPWQRQGAMTHPRMCRTPDGANRRKS